MASISATESFAACTCDSREARWRRTLAISTKRPPERKILRANSWRRPSIDSAAFLPSIARFSKASSTGNKACASSSVKVFISNSSISDSYLKHPVQRNASPVLHVLAHLDAVDDSALNQVFERPGEVLRADAIHSSAETASVVEGDDFPALWREFLCQAIHQVNLRSDREH